MAKRFTDTEKWKRPWYRKLPPALRELWNYILDQCDHSGIWLEDLELASMILGLVVDSKDYEKHLGPKLIRIAQDKVFIPSFVEFQYGELDSECKNHQTVIKRLTKYGIDPSTLTVISPYQKKEGDPGIPEGDSGNFEGDMDKEEDKEKEKKKGGMGENKKTSRFDFEPIYREYPRKEGKQEGLAQCKRQIKTQEDYDKLFCAVRRYRAQCERELTEKDYIKHFSSFMGGGKWRDYLDDDVGTSLVQGGKEINWDKLKLELGAE